MDYSELLLFGMKTLLIVVAALLILIVPFAVKQSQKTGRKKRKKLLVEDLKKHLKSYTLQIQKSVLDKKSFKAFVKGLKKTQKQKSSKRFFVLEFKGDKQARQVETLREEINLLLKILKPEDEVVLNLESPGGAVAEYGLAASQLQRLREANIPLTICVDKVAASGGYLMACVGNKIVSSPFAFIGSIGVLYGLPNLHEFLKKRDISYEEITAGKFKRTLTPFGKVTEEKREKLQEQIDLVHKQFQSFLKTFRPHLNFDEVATGEAWLGDQALKLGLVDEIKTSDAYLMEACSQGEVYKISLEAEQSFMQRLSEKVQALIENKSL